MDTVSTSIWQDIFGVSYETAFQTIVPALIAIIIFFLGFLIKWIGNKIKIHKENNQKREFIFSQVEVVLTALIRQRTAINNFIELLKVDKTQFLEFELNVTFNPKHLFQIGSNEMFKVLVLSFWRKKKERLKIFNSLLGLLDLIDGLKNQFKESFAYILEQGSKYDPKWNDNIKIISELHDNWKIESLSELKNPIEDDFLYGFNQLYLRYITTADFKDMYIAVPNFIEPTLQFARTHLPNIYAQKLSGYLLECMRAYNGHKNLRKFKIEEFEMYLTQLNEIETLLNNFLKFYGYNYIKENSVDK